MAIELSEIVQVVWLAKTFACAIHTPVGCYFRIPFPIN